MTIADGSPTNLDNRLSFTDQLLFLSQRATGQELAMQVVWVYERPVNWDGVRRFHLNFGYGLFGRRIERSPLPFGRHRWVSSTGPACDIDVADRARPRAELGDWLEERAALPLDPEIGPGWHLGLLPTTEGSVAASLVLSHCLADGFGLFETIVDAVKGNRRCFGYPPPCSRGRVRTAASDLRLTARGAPEVIRALSAATRLAFRRRAEFRRTRPTPVTEAPEIAADVQVVAPAITIYIDLDDWDARANILQGNSHSLAAGFATKLGERMGRRRAEDGIVTLQIPISDRMPNDTRANAASIATVGINPAAVTTDLSGVRAQIRHALTTLRESPDETLQLLPLTPFMPERAVRRGSDIVLRFADLPVSFSNLGVVDPVLARLDGTDADYVMLRGVDRRVTKSYLERRGGLLTVLAGRIAGKMSLTVVAYRRGARNSKVQLAQIASDTLAEFGLTGVIE